MLLSRIIQISLCVAAASATPLQATFTNCESYYNAAAGINRLNVSAVYANLVPGSRAAQLNLAGDGSDVLRVDLVGSLGAEMLGFDETTNKLATLFTDTNVGGISVYRSTSWVCNSLFPSTLPTPYVPSNSTYCPLPAGPFGLNISIPLSRSYALTTLSTQVRIVDTTASANTLSCINISFTPYDHNGWYYHLFLWVPVALVVGFWITSWGARFAAGWVVGSGVAEYGTKTKDQNGENRGKELDKAGKRDARMRKWGTMLVSGLSGERLSVSSALLRFVTPGLRDIMHHIQFCTVLVMIAVSWPHFTYPIVAKLAWADLVWNSTIISGSSPRIQTNPTGTQLPTAFSSQMTNELYPLYLETNTFNPLLDLGAASSGMESFATAIGLRLADLFGTCLTIFLVIAAAIIVLSLLIWSVHALAETLSSDRHRVTPAATKRQSYGMSGSPGTSIMGEKLYDPKSPPQTPGIEREMDQLPTSTSQEVANRTIRAPGKYRRAYWRFRPKGEAGAFHVAALYGNLLRLILVFHLPITIFSTYQLAIGSRASIVSRVFAALSLIFISLLIPAGVMWKIYRTPSGKLYDATRTLLGMGTMYNHYVMDKQLFRICPLLASLVVGVVVGAGQGSGIAQAVILVLVELIMLVVPAVWYPWGDGASMGAASVFMGVIRVISALLVMLLSPVFSMTEATRTWLAYAILLLNAIIFIFFLFMLFTKLIEGLIRLIGGAHFDESTHPLDGGIFAAIADLDCLNGVTGGKAAARKRRKRGSRQLQRNVSAQASLTTQRMLDKYSEGVQRGQSDGDGIPGSPVYDTGGSYIHPYPRMSEGYFPSIGPTSPLGTLGPMPTSMKRLSSGSTVNGNVGGGGNIMDAWRPIPINGQGSEQGGSISYTPLGSPNTSPPINPYGPRMSPPSLGLPPSTGPRRSFSMVKGGRADIHNPYDVQSTSGIRGDANGMANRGDEFGRPLSPSPVRVNRAMPIARPTHPREYSSPVIIETLDGPGPSTRPSTFGHHSRQSSGAIGTLSGPGGMYGTYPTSPNNKRLSGGGISEPVELVPLRPPEMTIPKRRSLNDLKNHEMDNTSASEEETEISDGGGGGKGRKGKGKEKGKSRMWFSRTAGTDDNTTEESDDEPGPSRRRRTTSDRREKTGMIEMGMYDEEGREGKHKSWKAKFGIGRKSKGEDEEDLDARDENKARKDALANESGALFVGVDSPTKVKQKQKRTPIQRQSQDMVLGNSGDVGQKKGFVVNRKNPQSSPNTNIPLRPLSTTQSPIPTGNGMYDNINTVDPDQQPRSFTVKRATTTRSTPKPVTPVVRLPQSTKASPHDFQPESMDKVVYPPTPGRVAGETGKSFKVIRQGMSKGGSRPVSTAPGDAGIGGDVGESSGKKGSFVVHRQNGGRGSVSSTTGSGVGGYASDAFIPRGSAL